MKFQIKNSNKDIIGILTYKNNLFTFEYDKNFEGYDFGEIPISKGSVHKQNILFSLFKADGNFFRENFKGKNNLFHLSENELDIEILKDFANTKRQIKGFSFSQIWLFVK